MATIAWKLLPAGCALAKAQNQDVKPTGTHKGYTTEGVSKKVGSLTTKIRVPSAPNQGNTPRAVKYEFSELGAALGDKAGGYKNTVTHAPPTGAGDDDGDGIPDKEEPVGSEPGPGEPKQCPSDATGTYPSCACSDGWTYDSNKNDCLPVAGNELPRCTSAVISWADPRTSPAKDPYGYSQVDWVLLPRGCPVSDAQRSALPTGTSYSTTTTGEAQRQNPNGKNQFASRIKVPCAPNAPEGKTGDRTVKWDFSDLAAALGDGNLGAYNATVIHQPANNGCDGDVVPWPNDNIADENIARSPNASCSPTSTGAVQCTAGAASTCSGSTCFQLWANNQSTVLPLSKFKKPSWSVTGAPSPKMTLYLTKGPACKEAVTTAGGGSTTAGLYYYYSGPGDTNWDALADAECTVRITLHDDEGKALGWKNMPKPGNFVLNVKSGANNMITIKSFSAGKLN